MARPTPDLVAALRQTAARLRDGASYSWSRMGSCNCGHLAQTVTGYTKEQVQALALERGGDWSEQSAGYCAGTGLALETILDAMLRIGLTTEDVADLERLGNPVVLARAGRPLDFKRREDASAYLDAWADLLQDALLPSLPVPETNTLAGLA